MFRATQWVPSLAVLAACGLGGLVTMMAGLRPASAAAAYDPVTPAAQGSPPGVEDSSFPARTPPTAVDYLWVLRGALVDRASIDSVLARARRMGVRGLLVQTVGRGDACHRSDLLPRAEFLARAPADFDPFGVLVERARAEGLEVHAWINCLLVWSAPKKPKSPRHVINAHPEWIARLRDGRRMTSLGFRERGRKGVEGVFLSASHPGVRRWLVAVAREIAERYPVDGIHLDYIRHPSIEVGWDATSRARFALESGIDPDRFGRLKAGSRAAATAAWERFQRNQVTAIVRDVRDSVLAVRPGISISAAVVADTVRAERSNLQMWRDWVKDGLLDRAFLMCYAAPVQTVMDQLRSFADEFANHGRLIPGIAMYNTAPVAAALKIRGARALGYASIALYSYDSLFQERTYWTALRDQILFDDQENR